MTAVRFVMRSNAVLASLLPAWLLLVSCGTEAAGTLTQCVSRTVGRIGGSLSSPSGAAIEVPPGTFAADVVLSVCVLEVGRVPRQRSPVVRFGPVDRTLGGGVLLTLPIDDASSPPTVGEIRRVVSDEAVQTVRLSRIGGGTASFVAPSLGDARLMGTVADGPLDAGLRSSDVDRPDAPRPPGPVVTGRDLTPADYACLGQRTAPIGAVVSTSLHTLDWADGTPRAGYFLHLTDDPSALDASGGCTGASCRDVVSDAWGQVTASLREGPLFLSSTPGTTSTDRFRTAARQWILAATLPVGATTLDVHVLSEHTVSVLATALGPVPRFAVGRIHDCSGALVQRARVRLFDADGLEQTSAGLGPGVVYGDGLGFPSAIPQRSTVDGVYVVPIFPPSAPARMEAWGQLSSGGGDVLLACETVLAPGDAAILADLGPLRGDAPAECGSVP